ncbi:MAG: hypothetical protein IIA14_16740, partial [SAR324 cluster bacterium]|nr:hypothetical protein [SAR324 cluster bacterium]
MELDLEREDSGEFSEVHIFDSANGIYLTAERLFRTAPGRYQAVQCSLTTCKPGTGGWLLSASEIDYRVDNFAVGTNAVLTAGPVPIFWFPWVAWPTVRTRQTGFLGPSVSTETSDTKRWNLGTRVKIPFFLALGPDHDLTLTPENISRRGPALGAEYAYSFRADQTGLVKLFGIGERFLRQPDDENRMGLSFEEAIAPTRYTFDWNHNQGVGEAMRLIFSAPSTINFRKIIDKGLILLVNLPKGLLGEGASSLLAAFIVAHIQKAALSRADSVKRRHFYLYLDEFQNYTTDNIRDILSESRKYALSLTLAHQYLDQLPSGIRQALLNTAGNLACFRLGSSDASRIAREIFPWPGYLNESRQQLRLRRFGILPRLTLERNIERSSWGDLSSEIANLRHREFWFRRKGSLQPSKQMTFSMPDPMLTPELESNSQKLMNTFGENFGRLKVEIRKELK